MKGTYVLKQLERMKCIPPFVAHCGRSWRCSLSILPVTAKSNTSVKNLNSIHHNLSPYSDYTSCLCDIDVGCCVREEVAGRLVNLNGMLLPLMIDG